MSKYVEAGVGGTTHVFAYPDEHTVYIQKRFLGEGRRMEFTFNEYIEILRWWENGSPFPIQRHLGVLSVDKREFLLTGGLPEDFPAEEEEEDPAFTEVPF